MNSTLLNGALLIDKPESISSFGVIEFIQKQWQFQTGLKKKDLPKLGHGGTLDPFATGLLIILVGKAVKLARYFLSSTKSYEGWIRFGETTLPGDPTAPISERCSHLPSSIESLRKLAHDLTQTSYFQTPPMYSAKKKDGKRLYQLARAGIEVEREPQLCSLDEFKIENYNPPEAFFELTCSAGTYVRTLSQDFGKKLGTVALLASLRRTACGNFRLHQSLSLKKIIEAENWDQLPCWIPFDRLLEGYSRVEVTPDEREALIHGKQKVLLNLLPRRQPQTSQKVHSENLMTLFCNGSLIALARKEPQGWSLERVFH